MANPTLIVPGLFLGGLSTASRTDCTHVLSLVSGPVPVPKATSAMRLHIDINDSEDADLLSRLPQCIAFISDALKGGGSVLVHCVAGYSRSPAVVAAYLMATEGLSITEALALIEQRRLVQPNAGFMAQLRAFEEMGCRLDEAHPFFKRARLSALSERRMETGCVDVNDLSEPSANAQALCTLAYGMVYRCRSCRRLLATSGNVMPSPSPRRSPEDRALFANKRRGASVGEAEDTQLFVEPMQWMAPALEGLVQGKLHCPKCGAKLGMFNWAGMQNTMGGWVTPAFCLHRSRLDALLPAGGSELPQIQQPVLS